MAASLRDQWLTRINASLRDCKSSNLLRVTGIGFLLIEGEVAWRNIEVYFSKELANRIHASIFSSFFFFSKKIPIVVVRDVCDAVRPSVRPSVACGK